MNATTQVSAPTQEWFIERRPAGAPIGWRPLWDERQVTRTVQATALDDSALELDLDEEMERSR
jgi:hypothetical protein